MTYPQRIIHFPGRNIGFRQRVSKWLRRKLKLNPTSSEESSKTLPKTPSQDSHYDEFEAFREDALRAYEEAAKSDAFLFGDYDGYEAYKEDS